MLDGRVIAVSGVGPGLGLATAQRVLREGASVALADLDGDRLASIAAALGDGALAHRTDITKAEECESFAAAVAERFGRCDGVVHVAALDTVVGGMLDGGLDDWDGTAAVNVKGTMQMTRALVPLLLARGGSIVIVNTVGALRPRAEALRFAYGVSKGALLTAASYLAAELGPLGIRVNSVLPGWKWGPVLEGWAAEQARAHGITLEAFVDTLRAEVSLRQLASDDDVADSILFFLGDLSSKVTAQSLIVDGGGKYS